ncbi:MAG: iron-containing alcohol dehydrogenase [Candidatus Enterosoma sp.]|nr:iron-containing alcohol dehydrogenase [Bacilli bacterium]MDD7607254.1 iron-containing alcohol dehydrogenase [bacterium]MDY3907692.1 iron-containing alcohol dehydrogenase [Candidatus Enterosoma sp.]MDY5649845.1 iron-containing alcohol dehydrogenase [Candidatus Enterosoma sp.]MDY5865959.1 iron-containing alcohol dehydrogenase [Candidatus Enterosoma sp.]
MRFTLPRDVYFGADCLDELKSIRGHKAIVVTGGHAMQKYGFLDKVVSNLKEAGLEVKTFEGVENDPTVGTVYRGAEAMREFEPDWIVALGGGSPIDAAKAMWVFYEYPDSKFEDLVAGKFPVLRQKAKFAAIGSTSGTGTEVTAFAVITDPEKGIKYPLANYEITPDLAIVDPALPASMPKNQVAWTGMDALTHAVEAYVSTFASDFADPLSLKAAKMVNDNIVASYYGDPEARANMHYAQCIAGMAFTNALLGITHSLAHKTGAAFSTGHVPHGCANAMYLPHVIECNAHDPRAHQRYAQIAEYLGLGGYGEDGRVRKLIERVRELDRALNIPHGLQEFGVKEDEFLAKVDTIAHNAVLDACTPENPRKMNDELMANVLKCCYYDKVVNF